MNVFQWIGTVVFSAICLTGLLLMFWPFRNRDYAELAAFVGILILLFGGILAIGVVLAYRIPVYLQHERACESQGGVSIHTRSGFECVQRIEK